MISPSVEQLRLRFHEPNGFEVRVTGLNVRQPRAKLYQDEKPVTKAKVDVAVGSIFELSVRLADIDRKPHDPVHFAIEAIAKKNSLDRARAKARIELRCPDGRLRTRHVAGLSRWEMMTEAPGLLKAAGVLSPVLILYHRSPTNYHLPPK